PSLLLSLLLPSHDRPPAPTLFPYTTLFRSDVLRGVARPGLVLDPELVVSLADEERSAHGVHGRYEVAVGPQGLEDLGAHARHERSEEHTSELQSRENLVCRLLLEKKNKPYY